MKVLDLRCSQQHDFEGWFGSEDDFASQQLLGLLSCPLCGDGRVHKMLSAPRLNLRATQAPDPARSAATVTHADANGLEAPSATDSMGPSKAQQGQLLAAMRRLLAQTEDVGEHFAQQALAMHQGQTPHRNIRGQATAAEARELVEEGVDILPLPELPALKETLQ